MAYLRRAVRWVSVANILVAFILMNLMWIQDYYLHAFSPDAPEYLALQLLEREAWVFAIAGLVTAVVLAFLVVSAEVPAVMSDDVRENLDGLLKAMAEYEQQVRAGESSLHRLSGERARLEALLSLNSEQVAAIKSQVAPGGRLTLWLGVLGLVLSTAFFAWQVIWG